MFGDIFDVFKAYKGGFISDQKVPVYKHILIVFPNGHDGPENITGNGYLSMAASWRRFAR
jgi:hypothetical protein